MITPWIALQCKYKWFSASDLCKAESHPLKVIDTVKRFFKCDNCSNRTVTLEIVPLICCKQCGGSKWSRAGMIRVSGCHIRSKFHLLRWRGPHILDFYRSLYHKVTGLETCLGLGLTILEFTLGTRASAQFWHGQFSVVGQFHKPSPDYDANRIL